MDEPGAAIRLPGGIGGGFNGETEWLRFKSSKTGETSRQPIAINLHASDRAIRREIEQRKAQIGLPVSVNAVMRHVTMLREKAGITTRKAVKRGDRITPPIWDWIEWMDERRNPKITLNRSQLTRLAEAKKLWKRFLAEGGEAWISTAQLFRKHEARFTNP